MTAVASDSDGGCAAGGLSLRVISGELKLRELWLDGEQLAANVTVGASKTATVRQSQWCF